MKTHKKVIIIVMISTILSIIALTIISAKLKPLLIEIGTFEASKLESSIINNTISEMFSKKDNTISKMFDIITSSDDKIQSIDFNSNEINKILGILTIKIQNNLNLLEDGIIENLGMTQYNTFDFKKAYLKKGIALEIPIGIIFNNSILAGLGPKIPIKIYYLGDVNSNVSTKIKEYGINSALMEIYINIEVEAKIVLPFMTNNIKLNTSVPVAMKIIQGNVPKYYGGEIFKNSSLYSTPIE